MDDIEARVRCLELAAVLNKPSGDYSADAVVKTASVLYTFTKASPEPEKEPVTVDKQNKGGRPKKPDILS